MRPRILGTQKLRREQKLVGWGGAGSPLFPSSYILPWSQFSCGQNAENSNSWGNRTPATQANYITATDSSTSHITPRDNSLFVGYLCVVSSNNLIVGLVKQHWPLWKPTSVSLLLFTTLFALGRNERETFSLNVHLLV